MSVSFAKLSKSVVTSSCINQNYFGGECWRGQRQRPRVKHQGEGSGKAPRKFLKFNTQICIFWFFLSLFIKFQEQKDTHHNIFIEGGDCLPYLLRLTLLVTNVSNNELMHSLLLLLVEGECTTSPGSEVDKRSRSGCFSYHVIYVVTICFKTTFYVFILIIDNQAVSGAYSFLWQR